MASVGIHGGTSSGGGGGGNVVITGPLGQADMDNSVPVVIASDQSPIEVTVVGGGGPVDATIVAPLGQQVADDSVSVALSVEDRGTLDTLASESTLAAIAGLVATDVNLVALSAKFPSPLGQTTKANSLSVALASDQGNSTETTLATRLSESDFDTKVGSLTESAPASDTASSGLNGRLQRIAQRITSLIALLPASLGLKTEANSFAVVLAPASLSASSPTAATVGVTTASAVASNANRRGLILVNTHATQRISLGLGASAVLDSGITIHPLGTYVMTEGMMFTGTVNAIASGATTNMAVQEFT